MNTRPHNPRRRGFSLVELLVALTISATLLTSMMVALDFMFKRYTLISDSASTHVVARTVMHRVLSMIRTGSMFDPAPPGEAIFDINRNPFDGNRVQFVRVDDNDREVRVTVETRDASTMVVGQERVQLRGPFVLWLVTSTTQDGATTVEERPLLDGIVRRDWINLHFDVGNRLRRATIDLEVLPIGSVVAERQGNNTWSSTVTLEDGSTVDRRLLAVDPVSPTIRLVGSVSPRGER